ncbi:MAG TPA: hypothetical protein VEH77_13285 [Roseiarcus sp.]|nr:hypothetical protein [Roseiarcus sp.]
MQVARLVEALVDVWTTLKLKFEKAKVIPLFPHAQREPAECAYPEMKKAAESKACRGVVVWARPRADAPLAFPRP